MMCRFFFFQAEDGIRDADVTGVQTCALPISAHGKVAVLVFGFTKASKVPTSAWAQKINAEFGTHNGCEWYELPVLEDVPRLTRGMVISSIKKGVPESRRSHFV